MHDFFFKSNGVLGIWVISGEFSRNMNEDENWITFELLLQSENFKKEKYSGISDTAKENLKCYVSQLYQKIEQINVFKFETS